ncbi:hypothetical protein NMY22_g11118 [Coprinellus aureogranulatus]|nr:hypothetical protein NMY22_g11118 [Coprinellus aureogranulatus]
MSDSPLTPDQPSLTKRDLEKDFHYDKAKTGLIVSFLFAGPTFYFAFYWLFGQISREGFPTCNERTKHTYLCDAFIFTPLLPLFTCVFDLIALSKIAKHKRAKPQGVPGTAEQGRWGGNVEERTPLLAGDTRSTVQLSSGQLESHSPVPRYIVALAWTFVFLWDVFAAHTLINLIIEVAPGTTWSPLAAGNLCVLLPLSLLQVWLIVIVALSCARIRSTAAGDSEEDDSREGPLRRGTPSGRTTTYVLLSCGVLFPAWLSSSAQLPFIRLFLLTTVFDFAVLLVVDIHDTLTPQRKVESSISPSNIHEGRRSPNRRAAWRIFFFLVSLCSITLALLWTAWSLVTAMAATFSLLSEWVPTWKDIRLPIPERKWGVQVVLEAFFAVVEGYALAVPAFYALKEVVVPGQSRNNRAGELSDSP